MSVLLKRNPRYSQTGGFFYGDCMNEYEIRRFQPERPRNKKRVFWKIYKGGKFCQTFDRKKDAKRWIELYGSR